VELAGYAASAFFISWVVSRVARWLLFKRTTGWRRAVWPNLLALALLTLLEALGSPGGNPRIVGALLLYGSSALLLSVIDLAIVTLKESRTPRAS
jgi:hypothetical protein